MKLSKLELLEKVRQVRARLGKATDAATKARYEAYNKDKLIEEYFRLLTIADTAQPKPAPSTPGTAELTQLFLHLEQQRREDLDRAERQRRADLERMEEQRRVDQERAEVLADKRLTVLLESLQIPHAAPAQRAPQAGLGAAATVPQQRGPRTFDYAAVTQLSQDSTYREFKEWREAWTNNARVKQFSSFDRETQVYSIVSAAGPHASRVLKTHLSIDLDDNATTAETVLAGLQTYYREQRSVVVDRVAFRSCKQKPSETFDEYRFRLTDLADDADLCNHCRDTQIVTQIIYGLNHEKARNELLQKSDFPSLDDTVKLCRAFEVADRNQAKLEGRGEISRVSAYKKEKQQAQQAEASDRARSMSQDRDSKACFRCGHNMHKIPNYCPAQKADCKKCGKIGHWAKVCRSSGKDPETKPNNESTPDIGLIKSVYIASVSEASSSNAAPTLDTIDIEVKSKRGNSRLGTIAVVPDTGAAVNIMTHEDYARLGRDISGLRRPTTVLKAYNDLPISLIGQAVFKIRLADRSTKQAFFITDVGKQSILSRGTAKALGIIPKTFPEQISSSSAAEAHFKQASGTAEPQSEVHYFPNKQPGMSKYNANPKRASRGRDSGDPGTTRQPRSSINSSSSCGQASVCEHAHTTATNLPGVKKKKMNNIPSSNRSPPPGDKCSTSTPTAPGRPKTAACPGHA